MESIYSNKTDFGNLNKQPFYQMYLSIYAVTFSFVLTSNLMLIYGFYKTLSRPFKIITKLFIYLSLVDIVLTIVYVVFNYIILLLNDENRLYYALSWALYYSSNIMALLIFWTISVLRYLSIFKPMFRVETHAVNMILLEVLICLLVAIVIIFVCISSNLYRFISISTKLDLGLQFVMIFMNLSLNISSLIILRRLTTLKARKKKDNVLGNPMVVKQKKIALNTLLLITIFQSVCNLSLTFL